MRSDGPHPPGAFSGKKERRRRKLPTMVKRRDNRSSSTKKFSQNQETQKVPDKSRGPNQPRWCLPGLRGSTVLVALSLLEWSWESIPTTSHKRKPWTQRKGPAGAWHLGPRHPVSGSRSPEVETGAIKDAQRPHLLSKKALVWTTLEAGTSQGWKQAEGAAVKQEPGQRERFTCHSLPAPCEM